MLGDCVLCGRLSWVHDGDRWVHPCCVIEVERWGNPRCSACDLAESERRRWESRRQEAS